MQGIGLTTFGKRATKPVRKSGSNVITLLDQRDRWTVLISRWLCGIAEVFEFNFVRMDVTTAEMKHKAML